VCNAIHFSIFYCGHLSKQGDISVDDTPTDKSISISYSLLKTAIRLDKFVPDISKRHKVLREHPMPLLQLMHAAYIAASVILFNMEGAICWV
jgi:hypothetical protein